MSYQKHTWVSKEIITATNLNHIESGIYNEEQRAVEAEELIRESMSSYVSNTDYATTGVGGVVKVDGETITINSNGVISSSGTSVTVDSELSSESANPVQNSVITNALENKADSSSLSTVATSGSYNDLSNKPTIPSVSGHTITDGTTTYTQRSKLKFVNCTITDDSTNDATTVTANGSTITVDSALSSSSTNPVQNKVITSALGNKADTSSLATVATSGSYNDLTDKPTITGVNDATLTLQKNGTTVATFSANASTDVTANITVSDDFKMGTTRAGATADTLYFVYS